MIRVFIGYDEKETLAYHALAHSIIRRASAPVAITPLARQNLPQFTRPRGPLDSTDFSISRFLVPWLCDFKGRAIFMDCDMLMRGDVAELLSLATGDHSLWCVKHDYSPKETTKFLGNRQTRYAFKNWSSLMVFDNEKCGALTLDYVNEAPGLDLHQFVWLDKDQIGALPLEWNWLIGAYPRNIGAKLYHYTSGGPWFPEYRNVDHADLWRTEVAVMSAGMVTV